MPPCPFFENAAVREAKSTCFQPRKQMLGAVFGFGSGALPFPLFNPSANQDDRKHSDHNHCGNPYGRKHPYPTPLDNSQQLQCNKDNRQNGYDAKPALFCFIIHNRPPQMRIYGVTISKMSGELFGNQPVFSEHYQKNISDGNADNSEHCVRNIGGIQYRKKALIYDVQHTHYQCRCRNAS